VTTPGPTDGPTEDAPGVRTLPVDQAAPRLDDPDALVLDIRTGPEVAQAHLPGAVQLDYYAADFPQRLGELDRDVPVLLYCRSGQRSADAAALMQQLGFRDVIDVQGGIIAWSNAGLPLTR
jgi:phage shock protein E